MSKQYTPQKITKLLPHQIVVFGSNNEGKHGKGMALLCKQKFGAIQFQSRGLQGQSYAIITKDLHKGEKSIPLDYIQLQIGRLYEFAKLHPEKEFLFTKIGTQLAGWSEKDLERILSEVEYQRPDNVILPYFGDAEGNI